VRVGNVIGRDCFRGNLRAGFLIGLIRVNLELFVSRIKVKLEISEYIPN
jgi:protein tyrosine/serine phosphatase